jgi:hypothetical protein
MYVPMMAGLEEVATRHNRLYLDSSVAVNDSGIRLLDPDREAE